MVMSMLMAEIRGLDALLALCEVGLCVMHGVERIFDTAFRRGLGVVGYTK